MPRSRRTKRGFGGRLLHRVKKQAHYLSNISLWPPSCCPGPWWWPCPHKIKGKKGCRKEEVGRGICFGCKRAPVSEAGEQKEGGVKLLLPLGWGEQDRAEPEVTAAWQRERATGHSASRRDKPGSTQDVDVPAGASSLAPGPRPCCSWHCSPSFREAATLAAGWKQSREKGAAPALGGHRWTLWSPGPGPKAGRVNALHGSGGSHAVCFSLRAGATRPELSPQAAAARSRLARPP